MGGARQSVLVRGWSEQDAGSPNGWGDQFFDQAPVTGGRLPAGVGDNHQQAPDPGHRDIGVPGDGVAGVLEIVPHTQQHRIGPGHSGGHDLPTATPVVDAMTGFERPAKVASRASTAWRQLTQSVEMAKAEYDKSVVANVARNRRSKRTPGLVHPTRI